MPYIFVYGTTTYNALPDPFQGITPMTNDKFVEMGGSIEYVGDDIEDMGVHELGLEYDVIE